MSRLASCIVALVTVAGCHHNDNYCPGANPDNNCFEIDAKVIDGSPQGCTSDDGCSTPTAVCDTGAMMCVQCTASEASACTSTTPVCGGNDKCRACAAHSECASDVCLPDGSCSDGTNVAYVDPAGTNNSMCTKAMPCTKVAMALATIRPYVKFTGATDEAVTVSDQNVTFLADPGAKLTRSSPGNILTIDGSSTLGVFDLEISGALGTGGSVSISSGGTQTVAMTRVQLINDTGTGGGVSAAGGTLTISQSTISGNNGGGISTTGGTLTVTQSTISGNTGGGISVTSSEFTIVNNFIAGNGGPSPTDTVGGIEFGIIAGSGNRQLDFNTITANAGGSSVNAGVNCGTVTVPVTFSNNIIYGNLVSGGGKQLGGSANCSTTYSDIGPDTASGMGNINSDPMFVNAAQSNYHIMSGSPCKDTADPAATLNIDFDGDSRPQGPHSDIGADEFKP